MPKETRTSRVRKIVLLSADQFENLRNQAKEAKQIRPLSKEAEEVGEARTSPEPVHRPPDTPTHRRASPEVSAAAEQSPRRPPSPPAGAEVSEDDREQTVEPPPAGDKGGGHEKSTTPTEIDQPIEQQAVNRLPSKYRKCAESALNSLAKVASLSWDKKTGHLILSGEEQQTDLSTLLRVLCVPFTSRAQLSQSLLAALDKSGIKARNHSFAVKDVPRWHVFFRLR